MALSYTLFGKINSMKFGRFAVLIVSVGLLYGTWQWSQAKKQTLKADPQVYVTARTADEQRVAKKRGLQAVVQSQTQKYPSHIGLVVVYPKENLRAQHNAHKPFIAASLYKLFVAYEVYRLADQQQLTLQETLRAVTPGKTINECLKLMITVSDNDCGKALGLRVGWAALDKRLQEEGYPATKLNNYDSRGEVDGDKYTSANDVAKLLTRLYNKQLLSGASTDAFIGILKEQKVRDRLPRGLPSGTVIASKNGELYGYMHDAGIVFGKQAEYVIVMLSGSWNNPPAQALPLFKQTSQAVWEFFTPSS